jgi:hypothetical protein
MSPSAPDLRTVLRHAQLRWVGAPLLLSGVLLFLAAAEGFLFGRPGLPMLAVGGTLSGLAAFGANHDTAMALAMRLDPELLPPDLAKEVEQEAERLRKGAAALRPNQTAALLLPLISSGIQVAVLVRLLQG